jgi:hypothetical protein
MSVLSALPTKVEIRFIQLQCILLFKSFTITTNKTDVKSHFIKKIF